MNPFPRPTRAMQVALDNTPDIDDEELLVKAQRFTLAQSSDTFDGSAIRTTGVIIWRLSARLHAAAARELQFDAATARVNRDTTEISAQNDDLKAEVRRLRETITGYREALDTVKEAQVAEAPHNEMATSKKAAKEIAPIVNELRYTILNVLHLHIDRGLTADEIEVLTAISGNTVRPRLVEMSTLGWVRKTDKERTTRANRLASVWEITDEGRFKKEQSST